MMDLAYLLILLISRIRRIFMLSEVIKQTLSSSFNGLLSTLIDISTQMERIALRPSPIHAPRADNRNLSSDNLPLLVLECPLAVIVPLLRWTAPRRPPAILGGGGGGTYPRKMRIVMQLVCFLRRIPLSLYCHKWGANSEYSRIVSINPLSY